MLNLMLAYTVTIREIRTAVLPDETEIWARLPVGAWCGEDSVCRDRDIRVIRNELPEYCHGYEDHEYTFDVVNVHYTGDPMDGGHWE